MAEKCTNTSSPVSRWMNPKPFAALNHFTVPFSLIHYLLKKSPIEAGVAPLFLEKWKRLPYSAASSEFRHEQDKHQRSNQLPDSIAWWRAARESIPTAARP
jgi:hypothetical protein